MNYKLYKDKMSSLVRLSKKLHYHAYFEENLNNMKKTWEGINNLVIILVIKCIQTPTSSILLPLLKLNLRYRQHI